jgi:hypothetical protein
MPVFCLHILVSSRPPASIFIFLDLCVSLFFFLHFKMPVTIYLITSIVTPLIYFCFNNSLTPAIDEHYFWLQAGNCRQLSPTAERPPC